MRQLVDRLSPEVRRLARVALTSVKTMFNSLERVINEDASHVFEQSACVRTMRMHRRWPLALRVSLLAGASGDSQPQRAAQHAIHDIVWRSSGCRRGGRHPRHASFSCRP